MCDRQDGGTATVEESLEPDDSGFGALNGRAAKFALNCGIASLVLLVAGPAALLVPVVTVVGMVAAVVGLLRAYRRPDTYTGATQAWFGGFLSYAVFIVFGFFVAQLGNHAHHPLCQSDMRSIALELSSYAEANGGCFPASLDELGLPPTKLTHPTYWFYFFHSTHSYALNGHLAGKPADLAYPEQTIVLAESTQGEQKVFYRLTKQSFRGRIHVAFATGEVTNIGASDLQIHLNARSGKDAWFIKPQYR